jgi:hemerythrin
MGLVWRDQLSVGNNVIDSDHKYVRVKDIGNGLVQGHGLHF